LHHLRINGESARADIGAAENYPREYYEIMKRRYFLDHVIFNMDEMGHFWEYMPIHSFQCRRRLSWESQLQRIG
jgi:hypothetical protein